MNHLIALVEDSDRDARDILAHFNRLATDTGEHFDVRHFRNANAFLASYQPVYEMVLLDIDLGAELTGMEAAKLLRKMDSETIILFVTSLAQYAVDGYEVSALDFMVKPVNYATFQRKMNRALAHGKRAAEQEIMLKLIDGMTYRTSPSHIRYIEIQGHSIVIHTTEGNLNAYGSLMQLEEQLDRAHFARCHRSFLVNLSFVKGFHGQVVMVDNEELPIARMKRQEFLEALNKYLGGGI